MKCVHFAVHVKISSSYVLNTPQPCRLITKLRIMVGSMETKVVVKFEVMLHVELRARKLYEMRIHFSVRVN